VGCARGRVRPPRRRGPRRIRFTARRYAAEAIAALAPAREAIEGFFGLFKTGVRGAHHSVSAKWLQGYLNEWTWCYNRRESETPMFLDLLDTAVSRTV
jgi:ISXO2-like transposase domain